jgi:pyruvate carboxylase
MLQGRARRRRSRHARRRREEDLDDRLRQARSSRRWRRSAARWCSSRSTCRSVRHIEVQILGDQHGNVVHLHERDCSVQRRHQKVVEIAPAPNLTPRARGRVRRRAEARADGGYHNAGTFEFLVAGGPHYFIEVNPRMQVEHTVTEQITGIDLVQAQIRVEAGATLSRDRLAQAERSSSPRGSRSSAASPPRTRRTNFQPTPARSSLTAPPGLRHPPRRGDGLRRRGGLAHYDSLLVKVIGRGRRSRRPHRRAHRALREFRIRGVKTNIAFLQNVLAHARFLRGETWTRFIDDTPELFEHQATARTARRRLLPTSADRVVNGHPTFRKRARTAVAGACVEPPVPGAPGAPPPARADPREQGPAKVRRSGARHKPPLLTDTTMRDAHQSLLATRVRTKDMLAIAHRDGARAAPAVLASRCGAARPSTSPTLPATSDPVGSARAAEEAMPNVLHQMLLRGANAVGYTSYPHNVVEGFIDEAAARASTCSASSTASTTSTTMDRLGAARAAHGKIAEVALCYTGDVDNPARTKYGLEYYAELAGARGAWARTSCASRTWPGCCGRRRRAC